MCTLNSSKPSIRVVACDTNGNPHCVHGPTVLFERHSCKKSEPDRFYACAASRDRKVCSFFLKVRDGSHSRKCDKPPNKHKQDGQRSHSHGILWKRGRCVVSLPVAERSLCESCGLLLMADERTQHKEHRTRHGLTDQQLAHPSTLLPPLSNNKTNAQYLFSNKTVTFLTSLLRKLQFRKVLCVGVPRLHEELMAHSTDWGVSSLLMDIDHRLMQFYGPDQFLQYNMFNDYLFHGEKSRQTLRRFLLEDSGPVVVVTDPPFGGLAELLAHSVKALSVLWREANDLGNTDRLVPLLWFFPYFLEQKVISSLPQLHMTDYKVDYDNHKKFKNKDLAVGEVKSKQGSVVRIFTNIEASSVILPPEEGYRFCKKCERYVSRENRHCDKCEACTSKDGSTYTHCDLCSRCVKSSKRHCDTCGFCVRPEEDPCQFTKPGHDAQPNTTSTRKRKRKKHFSKNGREKHRKK